MTSTAETKSHNTLSPDHAYVVQLWDNPSCTADALSGRVEHIASGRACMFETTSELFDFLNGNARPSSSRTSQQSGL